MTAYSYAAGAHHQPALGVEADWLNASFGIYALTCLLAASLLAGAWIQPWVPIEELLRDPLDVAERSKDCCHLYHGAISNLGILIWTGCAAIGLFAGLVLLPVYGLGRGTLFMLSGGAFTALLALDDLYQLHDFVLPHFGVPQILVYAAYALVALVYLACFWRQLLEKDAVAFLLAGALLATSVGIDQMIHSEAAIRIFLEDGAKFLGIVVWSVFQILAALRYCGQAVDTGTTARRFALTPATLDARTIKVMR